MLIVTAAIIKKENKILIAQRKEGSHLAMKWEFPGGKLEEGEHPEACLTREIQEELGLTITIDSIYEVISHRYGEKHILLLCYLCSYKGGEAVTRDCNDFSWVEPSEMKEYDFAEADIPVVERLIKEWEASHAS